MAGGGGGDPGAPLGALAAHEARRFVAENAVRPVGNAKFGGGRARTEAGRSARTGRKSAWNDAEVFSDDDEGTKFGGRRRLLKSIVGGDRGAYDVGADVPSRGWWNTGRERGGGLNFLRAAGGARLAGIRGRRPPLDLLDDSAMRRHMLDQRGGGDDDEGGRVDLARARAG